MLVCAKLALLFHGSVRARGSALAIRDPHPTRGHPHCRLGSYCLAFTSMEFYIYTKRFQVSCRALRPDTYVSLRDSGDRE
jgi:hypothetical protein